MNPTNMPPRALAAQRYNQSRVDLLIVIIASIVNIALVAFEAGYMLLFSASIPYYAVGYGLILSYELYSPAFLVIGVCVALIVLGLYFVCWLLSKKNSVWMIVALVLFALDSVVLVAISISAEDFSGTMDLIFHAFILFHLSTGVYNGHKLKTLPEDPTPVEEAPTEEVAPAQETVSADSETDNV